MTYDASVQVDGLYPLVGARNEQLALHELLDSKHDSVFYFETNHGSCVVDGFLCVLDLTQSSRKRLSNTEIRESLPGRFDHQEST